MGNLPKRVLLLACFAVGQTLPALSQTGRFYVPAHKRVINERSHAKQRAADSITALMNRRSLEHIPFVGQVKLARSSDEQPTSPGTYISPRLLPVVKTFPDFIHHIARAPILKTTCVTW
jgi:hypothetical protein